MVYYEDIRPIYSASIVQGSFFTVAFDWYNYRCRDDATLNYASLDDASPDDASLDDAILG
jgi:hypothetical protein